MKKKLFIGVVLLVVGYVGHLAYQFYTSQAVSPRDEAVYEGDDLRVVVDYGRPYKKGRKIFGGLVPYGEYWRTGANEATEIEFSRDVLFGGSPVAKGRYRLYTIPEPARWTIVLNKELGQWGKFEPDHSLDLLSVEVPVLLPKEEAEQFTIEFVSSPEGAYMVFTWNRTMVRVPVK